MQKFMKGMRLVSRIRWFLAKAISYTKRSLLLSTESLSLSSEARIVDEKNSPGKFPNIGELYEDKNFISNEDETYFFPKKQARVLEQGILDLESNILYDSERRLVPDYSSWPPEFITLNRLPSSESIVRIFSKYESSEPVIFFPDAGFYHFLIENLPNFLWLQSMFQNTPIIAREKMSRFAEEVLEILNLEVYREIDPVISLSNLIYVRQFGTTGWPNPSDIKILRGAFSVPKIREPQRKTYVSRSSSRRSPRFERELESFLANLGWDIVHLERHNFEKQISIIANSRKLMGTHGAGLAQAVWLNKKSTLIEIRPKERPACFSRLASVCQLNYRHFELFPNSYYETARLPLELAAFLESLEEISE